MKKGPAGSGFGEPRIPREAPGSSPGGSIPSLFDPIDPTPAPVHADAHATEVLAAAKIYPRLGTIRRRVLDLVVASGEMGMSADDLCEALDPITPYSIRPRVTELLEAGFIRLAGVRDNRRGNAENVYRVVRK